MPRLIVEKGPDKNKSIKINKNDSIIVGRETTATLKINDLIASRFHFKIESRVDGYYISDLDSLNGTFVNGRKIDEQSLKIDDKIQIGETLFSFLDDLPAKEQWPIGQVIEGYRIIERVGRGGMGTVYKAQQLSLNRVVAIKLLSEEMVKDKNFISLFVQEARAAAQLNHHNIIQVYDVGSVKNIHYFSMEFLPGGSLEDIVSKRKKLPPEEALDIILQAARGLEYAEKKGIVHRDIKPDNLMIGEDKVIKICDLGLAKSLKRSFVEEQPNNVFGTPHYVAPEQALGKPVDHRADIYSLGSTFYRIISGVTPYTGSSIKEIISKKIKEDPIPLKQLEQDLSTEFCNIIDKMMKRDPEERYKTVSEVVDLLERVKNGAIPIYASADLAIDAGPIKRTFVNDSVLPGILVILSGLSVFLVIWYFYSYIRPYFSNVANNPPPKISSPEEEQRANEDFREAESYLKSMNTKEVASYVEAINRYERIIKNYPDTKLAPQIQARIDELNKQVGQLKKSAQQEYFEMKAEIEFKNMLDELKGEQNFLVEQFQVNGIVAFINKWMTKLTEFKTNYENTSFVSKAEDEKKQLQSWGQRVNYAKNKYEEVEKTANNALAENRINYAFNALTGFIKDEKYRGLLYDKVAVNMLQGVRNRALADYRLLWENVSGLIKQEDFEAAYQLLNKKQGFYGLPEVEQKVKDALTDVEKIIKERKDKEHQHLLDADQRSFYPTYIDAVMLAHQGDFTNAETLLKVIKVQTDYYKTRIKNVIYEISCERHIINAVQDNEQKLIISKKKFRNKRIEKIAKDGITIQGANIIPWSEITAAEIHELITKGWILSPVENLELGILCLKRGGMINEANNLFNKSKAGNPKPEESIIIDKYLIQLKEERAFRENDADYIFTQAERYYDMQQYFNALKSYNLLKLRFSDTELSKNNSKFIEDMIKNIGRILNEKNQQAPK